jgi:cobyrinic acid a,c-diamide synthase
MTVNTPRLVIAGLSGDAGKTIVSLSVTVGLRRKGMDVSPFKKGPDYIDAAWMSLAAGTVCRNLDTYLVDQKNVHDSFARHAANADIAIIEGNRGLFDGRTVDGQHSTAALARLLKAPIILVVDSTKATRTIAALVKGCQDFEPDLNIKGVILNKVGGERHRKIISEAIKQYCNLPIVGAIPRLGDDKNNIPGRHLGLVTPSEYKDGDAINRTIEKIADKYLDFDLLIKIAGEAGELTTDLSVASEEIAPFVKIGYFRDSVFTFYYPENLEALRRQGAELVAISSLDDKSLPELDALYIGGGFPETRAERLTSNGSLMASVKEAAEREMPIYAECGGLIYLSRSITWNNDRYSMVGLFPVDLTMNDKPVGHGYTLLEVDRDNPFFKVGTKIKGHEFHYSGLESGLSDVDTGMMVATGFGLNGKRDGMMYKKSLACYTHIHADGTPDWANSMINQAENYQKSRRGGAAQNFNVHEIREVSTV